MGQCKCCGKEGDTIILTAQSEDRFVASASCKSIDCLADVSGRNAARVGWVGAPAQSPPNVLSGRELYEADPDRDWDNDRAWDDLHPGARGAWDNYAAALNVLLATKLVRHAPM